MGLGLPEIAIIAIVFFFIFGPKKLPEIGKSLGQTIKNFRWSMKQIHEDDSKEATDNGSEDEKTKTHS